MAEPDYDNISRFIAASSLDWRGVRHIRERVATLTLRVITVSVPLLSLHEEAHLISTISTCRGIFSSMSYRCCLLEPPKPRSVMAVHHKSSYNSVDTDKGQSALHFTSSRRRLSLTTCTLCTFSLLSRFVIKQHQSRLIVGVGRNMSVSLV